MKLMHRFAGLAGAALFLLTSTAHAESPARIPLSGYLTTATGAAIDGEVEVSFTLYAAPSGGDGVIFTETRTVSAKDGRFAVQLGDGETPMDLSLFRDVDGLWLGISVDGDREMSPRIAMTSVPYAAHAQTAMDARTLDGLDVEAFMRVGDIDLPGLRTELDDLNAKIGNTSALKAAFDVLKQSFAEQSAAFESLREEVGDGVVDTVGQLAADMAAQKELVKALDTRLGDLGEFTTGLSEQIEAIAGHVGGDVPAGLDAALQGLSDQLGALASETDARLFQVQNDVDLAAVELSTATELVAAQNVALEALAASIDGYAAVAEQLAVQMTETAQQAGAAAELASIADSKAQAAQTKAEQALASGEALAFSLQNVQSELAAIISAGDDANTAAINQIVSDYSAAIGAAVSDAQAALSAVEEHVADGSFQSFVVDALQAAEAATSGAAAQASDAMDTATDAAAVAEANAQALADSEQEILSLTERVAALEAAIAAMQQ
jgi:hypothetical protein